MSSTEPPDNVHRLGVVRAPTADEASRESSLTALRTALERAEAGEVEEVLIILKHSSGDEDFSILASDTHKLSGWVGHLEQLKFDWQMHAYLAAKEQGDL